MFERATVFSAIIVFILFTIVGVKYFNFLQEKNQVTQTAIAN